MTTATAPVAPSSFIKHRVAVSIMFLMNGLLVGGWAPAIPVFKDKHGLAESELGLMILLIGIGSLLTMPITGAIIARRGSTGILVLAAWLCVPLLPLALFAPNLWLAGIALLLFGGGLGSMDVAMNANAARIEDHHSKAIMSSCHGFWSLGALIGSGVGGTLLGLFGLGTQALSIACLMLLGTFIAMSRLMRDEVERGEGIEKPKLALPRTLTIYLVAIIAFAGFTAEGTVLDWAALFLREDRNVPEWMAGYAFAAFAGTMALVRFVGDPVRNRLGDLRTMQISASLALVGFLMAGLAPNLTGTLLGFAIAGLGLANVVPIAFAAADRVPGIPRGIGISVATFCGYAGILVAPPLIGFVAEHVDYAVIFACVAALPLYCLLAARTVNQR
ncbi:MFS transporter [Ahrensia marina]|jgi:predicted MFS family arabinose efflux permease|uniref:MFS transporter n=1 Tax=Ahrensia marina TaxID=1514904 RepID=UPI0035D10ECB